MSDEDIRKRWQTEGPNMGETEMAEWLGHPVEARSNDGWIEGLPDKPGDYWFYRVEAGYPRLSRVEPGRALMPGSGPLTCICGDFLYARDFDGVRRRIWHKSLILPEPPEFDRTCPTCKGTPPRWQWDMCRDCRGTGTL